MKTTHKNMKQSNRKQGRWDIKLAKANLWLFIAGEINKHIKNNISLGKTDLGHKEVYKSLDLNQFLG